MSIWERIRGIFRRRGQSNIPMNPAGPDSQPGPDPGPPPFTVPPGARPVLVNVEEAHIPGVQDLRFRRREIRFEDDRGDTEYSASEVSRVVLAGCGCVVSGPNEVAYLSALSGLPVCKHCAKMCQCGHKVAPTERVMVSTGVFLCVLCHEGLQRQERRAKFWRTIIGPFISQE